jgi:hypothetical protein
MKLNFKLMNLTVRLLQTNVDEESNCVKIRWRISGLSNKSVVGIIKGWRTPKDVAGNIRDYVEYVAVECLCIIASIAHCSFYDS